MVNINTLFFEKEKSTSLIESNFYVRENSPVLSINTTFWFGQKIVYILTLHENRKATIPLEIVFRRYGVKITVERKGKTSVKILSHLFGAQPLPASYLSYLHQLGVSVS